MKKLIALSILLMLSLNLFVFAQEFPVRIKDIAKVVEVRDNQLIGFGLVVGLRNSGDTKNSLFTRKALTNLLKKMGIESNKQDYTARNVASVMVTATLPPFVKPGQRISVEVSSLGDSTSLVGGTLLLTPLKGADMKIYAVAQGPLVVGGIAEKTIRSRYMKNQATVGRIPNGAIVEKEVPVSLNDNQNITIVLNQSSFVNASRMAEAIRKQGFNSVEAVDAGTVKVFIDNDELNFVDLVAQIENVKMIPDSNAKVIINSKTGTVVIGEMVRLFPVAVTHGNISIRIMDDSDETAFGSEDVKIKNPITIVENKAKVIHLKPKPTLLSLVNALNDIGATPKDLISIIQALKASGALIAQIEII